MATPLEALEHFFDQLDAAIERFEEAQPDFRCPSDCCACCQQMPPFLMSSVEYELICRRVRTRFSPEQQEALLLRARMQARDYEFSEVTRAEEDPALRDSLPRRPCPFLGGDEGEDPETRRPGDTEIRRYGDTEIRRYGDTEIRSYGDTEIRRYGDTEQSEGSHHSLRCSIYPVRPLACRLFGRTLFTQGPDAGRFNGCDLIAEQAGLTPGKTVKMHSADSLRQQLLNLCVAIRDEGGTIAFHSLARFLDELGLAWSEEDLRHGFSGAVFQPDVNLERLVL